MRSAAATLLLLLSLLAVCAWAAPINDETRLMFASWAKQHNKHYPTLDELNRRLQVWNDNLAFVNKHNDEAARGVHTYTLGMNNLADLTNAEYRQKLLAYRRDNVSSSLGTRRHASAYVPPRSAAVPASVDWRTAGVVTPVKDQGDCGSCWSFSATGCMEGTYALKNKQLLSFSEQVLVDCVQNGAFTCDTGGEMQAAFEYVISKGEELETDYPYCACSGNTCKYNAAKAKSHFTSYKNIQSGSESALQSAAANQPIAVAIDASSQQFQLYKSGVFNLASCSSTQLDHGVLVAGYGALNNVDYWLVKNSWSASWGDKGYIMMSRNKNNQCGIATDACFITA